MTAYEVLGVAEGATDEALRAAWKRLAFEARQAFDQAKTSAAAQEAQERLRLVTRAWELLKPERRAMYDGRLAKMRLAQMRAASRGAQGDVAPFQLDRAAQLLGELSRMCSDAEGLVLARDERVRQVETGVRDVVSGLRALQGIFTGEVRK